MLLDDTDVRPRSLLDRLTVDPMRVAVGAAVTVAAHGIPALAYGIYVAVLALMVATGLVAADEPPPPPPIENVVEARFVTLGEVLDPHRLPNREVPILRTDTPEPRHAPSKLDDPPPPRERDEHRRQRDSVEDELQRLSEDAQIFAEREEARIREGSPDGLEEGTEREASPGDIYRGRLYLFFKRGWTYPGTMPADELARMQARTAIEIGTDLQIVEFRIIRSSGNPEFDQTVIEQLTRLRAAHEPIPPPPEEVAAQYLGQTIQINWVGRELR